MQGANASLWTRIEFEGDDLAARDTLILRMKYDDAVIAYLNGERLLRSDKTGVLHDIDIAEHLKTGDNWFAIAVTRGEKNYGLLVMGEAELVWPLQESRWEATDKLTDYDQKKRTTFLPTRSLKHSYTPRWTTMCTMGDWAWSRTEPGLKLTWDNITYPTIQPPGGMPEYSTAYFLLDLGIAGRALSGVLQILGDDSYEVYVNGHVVAVEQRADKAYLPTIVDITDYLLHGCNVIAAKVTNDWGPGRIHIQPTILMHF